MKYFLLFILNIFTITIGLGQTSDNEKEEKFQVIEKVPIYKGCEGYQKNKALKKCMSIAIAKHFEKYYSIETARKSGLSGTQKIYIIFTINKDGNLANVKHRTPQPILGKEAIRVLGKLPKFTPGYANGKTVRVKYTLPITVNIQPPTKRELRRMRKKKQKTAP